jgi:hypothetical protein
VPGSPQRFSRDESLRNNQTASDVQILETYLEFVLRPCQQALVDHWLRPTPAIMAQFFTGVDTFVRIRREKAFERSPDGNLYVRTADCAVLSVRPMGRTSRKKSTKVLRWGSLAYFLTRPFPTPKVSGYVQITHDGEPKRLVGTDGSRLYFNVGTATTRAVAQVSSAGGETARISLPSAEMGLLNLSPDGAELLVGETQHTEAGGLLFSGPLSSLPILGGSPRRLADAAAGAAAWSPDGKMLIYSNGSALFLAKSHGTEPHKLVSVAGATLAPEWSPDVSAYKTLGSNAISLWEVSREGRNLR